MVKKLYMKWRQILLLYQSCRHKETIQNLYHASDSPSSIRSSEDEPTTKVIWDTHSLHSYGEAIADCPCIGQQTTLSTDGTAKILK